MSTQPHNRVFPSPAPTSARGSPAPAPARPSTPHAACSSGSTFTFGPWAGKGRAGCRGARASQRGPEPQVQGDPPTPSALRWEGATGLGKGMTWASSLMGEAPGGRLEQGEEEDQEAASRVAWGSGDRVHREGGVHR